MHVHSGAKPVCGAAVLIIMAVWSVVVWNNDEALTEAYVPKISFSIVVPKTTRLAQGSEQVGAQLAPRVDSISETNSMCFAVAAEDEIASRVIIESSPNQQDTLEASTVEVTSEQVIGESVADSPFRLASSTKPSQQTESPAEHVAQNQILDTNQNLDQQSVEPEGDSPTVAPSEEAFPVYETLPVNESSPVNVDQLPNENTAEHQTLHQPGITPVEQSALTPVSHPSEPKADIVQDPKWPKPESLISQVEILQQLQPTSLWAQKTLQFLNLIHHSDSIGDRGNAIAIQQLQGQLEPLGTIANEVYQKRYSSPSNPKELLATELVRLRYSMTRQLAVWRAVHQLAQQEANHQKALSERKGRFQLASSDKIRFNVSPQWEPYLLTKNVEAAFNALNAKESTKRLASREILARMYSPVLSPEQSQHIFSHEFAPQTVSFLKSAAMREVDLEQILICIENVEQSKSAVAQYRLNDQYQSLLWSDIPEFEKLASEIETHYRNANFRLEVSDRLINRLVPQMPAESQPVSDNIMGARVSGNTLIKNQMHVELIPDPTQIHLRIATHGSVESSTQAQKSGFTIQNEGFARFKVFKRLAFGRHGVESELPVAYSSSNQRMVGMRSKLDPIPLVGWMARRIAEQKLETEAPQAEQKVKQKLESTARARMHKEVETQLAKARNYMYYNMLQPLTSMELEPDPIQMSTYADHLVMRYRLAGRSQMGASTVRPLAAQGSLLSFQIHQSTINNLFAKIDLSGEEFTANELIAHFQKILSARQFKKVEVREDVRFQFARFDPMRVDLRDDKIDFSLNLKSFKIGKKKWRNVTVLVTYDLQARGMTLALDQDTSGIRVSGRKFNARDQIAVRTIFNKIFGKQYSINVLPAQLATQLNSPNLGVSQLVIDRGWIGISISDMPTINLSDQTLQSGWHR